ncbi:MAG: ABC transporter ATP-binding protein, partial [Lachnospira sp.]|nr:ABC transporter ATP-binding protein [Lachnospira sp.]
MKRNNTVGNIALRHGILFVLGVVLSFITAGVTIYCNDTVAAAVDSVMSSSGEDKLYTYVIIIAIMAVVMLIATFLQNVISRLYSVKVQKECKEQIAERIPDMTFAYLDEKGSGSIMNRLISDVGELNKLFSENIPTLVSAVIIVISVVTYMMFLDWKLSLVTIIIYPVLLYLANYISNKVKKLVNLRRNLLDERTSVANDCIQGIIVGKSYNLEKVQDERIGKVIDTVFANERARTGIQSLSYILEAIIGWIPVVISYVLALFEVLNGSITVGDMLAFSVLLGIVSRNVEKIPMGIIELKEYLVSVKRLNQLMCAP